MEIMEFISEVTTDATSRIYAFEYKHDELPEETKNSPHRVILFLMPGQFQHMSLRVPQLVLK